jgi:hypothetical protein
MFTHPVQTSGASAGAVSGQCGSYFASVSRLQSESAQLQRARLEHAATLQRTQHVEAENERLRKLLGVKERQQVSGQVAQILYSARDPYARRVIVDKGQQDRVIAGQPVIDDGHCRSGDAGVSLRRRGHPDYRQGAGGAGAGRAYRHALGGFRARQRRARTAFSCRPTPTSRTAMCW